MAYPKGYVPEGSLTYIFWCNATSFALVYRASFFPMGRGSLNLVERRFDVKGLVEWFWQYVPIIWLALHYNNG